MKKLTAYHRRINVTRINIAFLVIFLNIIFLPSISLYRHEGNNLFHIFLNDVDCGYVGSDADVDAMIADARLEMAGDSDGIIYADADLKVEGSEVVFGKIDSEADVKANMVEALRGSVHNTRQPAVTVKIGDYSTNLKDSEAVLQVLQAALDLYQTNREFVAQLTLDPTRELNCITATVVSNEEAEALEEANVVKEAGFDSYINTSISETELGDELKSFDDYDYGINSMSFGNPIEIVDAYLLADQITDTETAIQEITVAQEVDSTYVVESGDTLSQIAEKVNIPMDKIIAMNNTLDDERSMIRVGDELTITMPEPVLSVVRNELEYVEEVYDAEIQYVYNDDWFTTDMVTIQQPSSGFHTIVAQTTYRNNKEEERTVVKEEVLLDAVPKIVEKGTKIPPTFIKPLAGGRLTSGFGYRNKPKAAGATAYHQGIDWGTPTGTTVYASSGGTVVQAGWMGGYGYVVYIDHPGGRQTRYAHLSKILVSKGQTVSQGQTIARSGNTGASTGPHVHFEIRINGTAVNPLKYL